MEIREMRRTRTDEGIGKWGDRETPKNSERAMRIAEWEKLIER